MHFSTLQASGKLLMLAGIATLAMCNLGRAQCCTSSSIGGEVMGGAIVEAFDPEAELEEPIDPARTINLTIVVPEKTIVKVNGEPTFTKGIVRNYIVRDLKPGKKYKFLIEGQYVNQAEAVYYDKEEVTIEAGSQQRVVLHLRRVARPPKPAPAVPPVPVPAA